MPPQMKKARDVHYRLLDPLLRFWFRFVYPHTSLIAQAGPKRALAQVIQPHLESYFGSCFETLCCEALPLLYDNEKVSAGFEIGSYWDSRTQIDIVGLRRDGWIDLGQCKWGTVCSLSEVAAELEAKIARYPNPHHATIGRRLFLRSFKHTRKPLAAGLRVHGLEELYALGGADDQGVDFR